MNTRIRVGLVVVVLPMTMVASLPAGADEPVHQKQTLTFGHEGQLVLSGATQFNLEHLSFSTPTGAAPQPSITSIYVGSSADVFILRGFSVGVHTAYGRIEESGAPAVDTLSIGPRVGYNLTINDHVSLWPAVSIVYGETWFAGGSHSQGASVVGYAPVLYHPVPHFFVGLGPNVLYAWSMSATTTPQSGSEAPKLTSYGISLTVGGWVPL